MRAVRGVRVWSVLVMWMVPVIALGAGFQVPEQGITSIGTGGAFIGQSNDLSAVYHNPAGLAQLAGNHVYGSVVGIKADATYTRPGFKGQDNTGDVIPVPFFAVATDFQGRLPNAVLAFAVNAPFGLANEYDAAGPQRYMTTNISLATVYAGPYVGWQAHPKVAVGAGVQYVHASAEIGQRINYGGVLSPTTLNENPQFEGVLDISDATDSGFAGNIGVLVQARDNLRIGVTWRSGIEFDIEAKADLEVPAAVTAASGGLIQSYTFDGKSTVSLPQILGGGIAFQPTPPLTLLADINWINWSVYESLDFDFSPDVAYLPDTKGPRNWDDTITLRCGAEYQIGEQYRVQAGYVFDQSPIPDATLGPELPTGDRHGITLGAGFEVGRLTIDLAYMHLFVEDRSVSTTLRDDRPLGEYESSADVFGIGVGYAF